jgi:glycerol uptake facilitator-like aquaporin
VSLTLNLCNWTEGNNFFGLTIGSSLLTAVLTIGGVSGACLNPAVGNGNNFSTNIMLTHFYLSLYISIYVSIIQYFDDLMALEIKGYALVQAIVGAIGSVNAAGYVWIYWVAPMLGLQL